MHTVIAFHKKAVVALEVGGKEAPLRISTTLFDLMTVLQDAVGPNAMLVMATMEHSLRSR